MGDQIDQAQAFELMHREWALSKQAVRPAMLFNGKCYNCGEPVERGCFCDADCRDDYELRAKQKRA